MSIEVPGLDVEAELRLVDDIEFDPNKLNDDGSQHETLGDYYYSGLHAFASMICLQIPKEFLGSDEVETEKRSVRAGFDASDECIRQLRAELVGAKAIELNPFKKKSQFDTLTEWYTDGFTEFLSTLSSKVPDKFAKDTPEKTRTYSARQAIKAFEKIKQELTK